MASHGRKATRRKLMPLAAVLRMACLPPLAAHVVRRILVKRSLAARGAEIVGHTAILGFTGGCPFVHFHTAYWVDSHSGYSFHLDIQISNEPFMLAVGC